MSAAAAPKETGWLDWTQGAAWWTITHLPTTTVWTLLIVTWWATGRFPGLPGAASSHSTTGAWLSLLLWLLPLGAICALVSRLTHLRVAGAAAVALIPGADLVRLARQHQTTARPQTAQVDPADRALAKQIRRDWAQVCDDTGWACTRTDRRGQVTTWYPTLVALHSEPRGVAVTIQPVPGQPAADLGAGAARFGSALGVHRVIPEPGDNGWVTLVAVTRDPLAGTRAVRLPAPPTPKGPAA